MISIIIPIYNEIKYIRQCITSILSQDCGMSDCEVLLVDGMSNDGSREIMEEYCNRYSFIKMLDNEFRFIPQAMNIGVASSVGEVIIRMDAHASYPDDYVSTLVSTLKRTNADNVGSPIVTKVLNENDKTLAIREVLCDKVGVGNSLFRVGVDEETEVDTVPFGCWRRSAFVKYGLFDERLRRNQDIEFNKRIKRMGGKILLVPDTYCIYWARESFKELARNNFQNGKWNILTVYYTGVRDSLSLRHFVPFLFLLSLFLPLLLSAVCPPSVWLTVAPLFLYVAVIGQRSLLLSKKKKLNPVYLFLSFAVLHFSYGSGSLIGIFSVVKKLTVHS